jgi:O-antigen chain-terminating methyltransferase
MKLQQNNPQVPVSELEQRAAAVQRVREELPPAFEFEAEAEVTPLAEPVAAAPVAVARPQPSGWKSRLTGMPVLGTLILWFSALARVVQWRQQLTLEAEHLQARVDALTLHLTELATHVDKSNHLARLAVDARLLAMESRIHRTTDQIKDTASALKERTEGLKQEIDGLRQEAMDEIREHNRVQAALRADLTRLQVGRTAVASAAAPAGASAPAPDGESTDFSRFYVDFENTFRGDMASIKERMRPQLRWLPEACHKGEALVVDVGCGRGEWLSLLRDSRIPGTGIDMNADMVLQCNEQGLDARCADAVQWLREQPPGSIGAVTAFHLIEHLPFEVLLSLFDAALQALRPDGMILFETPNPENLMVGACNFYLDPTHRNPIPPTAAQFIAMQRGFPRADILRLHPYDVSSHIKEKGETQDLLNYLLYGPQDYAIAAWKQADHAPAP